MAKTIKQIADEIGVTKQSVYKRFKGKLNTACAPYAHTEDGILYLDETGEQIIKNDFANTYYSNRDILERSNGAPIGTMECSGGVRFIEDEKTPENQEISVLLGGTDNVSETEGIAMEHSNTGVERSIVGAPVGVLTNDSLKAEYVAEIEFLHRQIDRLQDELEKEREHNREKDRQLLDTLTKLSETQAALAVGQSAEKQKALAETLIEGHREIENKNKEDERVKCSEVDEGREEQTMKSGFLRWIWSGITGKR